MTHAYPAPAHVATYEQLEALAARLEAEVAVFHNAVADPRTLPVEERSRVGGAFFVPWPPPPEVGSPDLEHFERVVPARFARALQACCDVLGVERRAARDEQVVRAAFAYGRYMQAWGAELVVARCVNGQAIFGVVASILLGVPLVACVGAHDLRDADGALLSTLVASASLVLVDSDDVLTALAARFGADAARRAQVLTTADPERLAGKLGRLTAAPREDDGAVPGPEAAFACRSYPAAAVPDGLRPFVILGAERTGSNMLVDLLSTQESFACAGELFNPRSISRGELSWLGEDTAVRDDLLKVRVEDPASLIERLCREGRDGGAQRVGFKLLYYHGVLDNRVVGGLAQMADLRIVHLKRRGRLRRWLSHRKAQLLDSWYTSKGASTRGQSRAVELDVVGTAADFAYTELLEERFAATFASNPALDLDYEELAGDLESCRRKLGEFFEVAMPELTPRSKKTGVGALGAAIENYAELEAAFVGTRWAEQFGAD